MRVYDEQVDVRLEHDAPSEFLWRGRLWRVGAVLSHGVEAGPWWTSPEVRAVVAADGSSQRAIEESARVAVGSRATTVATLDDLDLHAEQQVWRVEAHCPPRPGRPRLSGDETGSGVFDLVFSWTADCWRLTGRRG